MRFLENIVVWVNPFFPLTKALWANCRLKTQIESLEQKTGNTPYVENFRGTNNDDANRLHENTLDYRKSLTDKAKTNVFGITLAVTFIVGMTRIFVSVDCPPNMKLMLLLAEIATLMALVYMISGGLASLHTLQGQKTYDLTPADFSYLGTINSEESIQERVFIIARNIELNIKINLIINNMVSASYGFLRNGLICLLFSTFFVCAISYIKVMPKQTLADEIRPIIESGVGVAVDSLKSEQKVLNERTASNIIENTGELQNILSILDTIKADITNLEQCVNETNNLEKKPPNGNLEPIVK
jgi:hypothetical protein